MFLLALPVEIINLLPIYNHKDLISLRNSCRLLREIIIKVIKNWRIRIYSHIPDSKHLLKYYEEYCFRRGVPLPEQLRIFSEYYVTRSRILLFPKARIESLLFMLRKVYSKERVFQACYYEYSDTGTNEIVYRLAFSDYEIDQLVVYCFQITRFGDIHGSLNLYISLDTPLENIIYPGKESMFTAMKGDFIPINYKHMN
jgi:hypothetical protein